LGTNGRWSPREISLAVIEIKRFLILRVLANDYNAMYLSPSLRIDKLWHKLLLFNEYTDMCLQLSTPVISDRKMICSHIIGHNPLIASNLGQNERFQRTIEMYEKMFDQPAPAAFWKDGGRTNHSIVRKRLRREYEDENEIESEDLEDFSNGNEMKTSRKKRMKMRVSKRLN
jgi:hypothetical protein